MNLTLAISCNTLFFFSTTPFCWGVLEAKNSCLITLNLQKRPTSTLSNSLLLLLLILTIWWLISTFILLNNDFKCSMASDFSLRKLMKGYLEKSSTITRTYLLPPLLLVRIRLIRPMWRRSKGLVVLISLTFLCELLVCLLFMYSPQMGLGSPLSLGIYLMSRVLF